MVDADPYGAEYSLHSKRDPHDEASSVICHDIIDWSLFTNDWANSFLAILEVDIVVAILLVHKKLQSHEAHEETARGSFSSKA